MDWTVMELNSVYQQDLDTVQNWSQVVSVNSMSLVINTELMKPALK